MSAITSIDFVNVEHRERYRRAAADARRRKLRLVARERRRLDGQGRTRRVRPVRLFKPEVPGAGLGR
jgi:hypothetical protein